MTCTKILDSIVNYLFPYLSQCPTFVCNGQMVMLILWKFISPMLSNFCDSSTDVQTAKSATIQKKQSSKSKILNFSSSCKQWKKAANITINSLNSSKSAILKNRGSPPSPTKKNIYSKTNLNPSQKYHLVVIECTEQSMLSKYNPWKRFFFWRSLY